MESLSDCFKAYDTITDPELKLTLDTMKKISGTSRLEDVAWYWESKKEVLLSSTNINNIEPLKYLKQAESIVLFSNRITNISPITGLTTIRHLNLIDNDVLFLDGINQLTVSELYLGDNLITNVNPLSNMTNLKILGLKNNKIKDVSALKSLIGLVQLNLTGNPIDSNQIQSLRGSLPGCKILF